MALCSMLICLWHHTVYIVGLLTEVSVILKAATTLNTILYTQWKDIVVLVIESKVAGRVNVSSA